MIDLKMIELMKKYEKLFNEVASDYPKETRLMFILSCSLTQYLTDTIKETFAKVGKE